MKKLLERRETAAAGEYDLRHQQAENLSTSP
jgi:hypothetical protein